MPRISGVAESLWQPVQYKSKGDYWDNTVLESFFHTLKVDLIHDRHYQTRQEVRAEIFDDYIEVFYNQQLRHSALDYLSLPDFEKRGNAA